MEGTFKLNRGDIKEVNSVRYPGRIICSDSKDDKDIIRQCHQLCVRGNVLFRTFYMSTNDVQIKLFSTFCSSMHAAQLWWNHNVSTDYMYVKITCLDDYSDYPNTVVRQVYMWRDSLQTVKQSYATLYKSSCHV